jgi:uncharacterized repeat protein (TIGR01451 family)
VTLDTYYKFGPTPGNPTDHWYEFLFDGTTGAEFLDDQIVLHLVDGARGDHDLQANGQIEEPGGPGEVLKADLSLSKVDTPDPVDAGGILTYTLTIVNSGFITDTAVILTDTLPAEVTFVSAASSQGTCAETGGTVTCDLGDLAVQAQVAVTLTVTADLPGRITNQAQVTGSQPEFSTFNNDDEVQTTVQADFDLSITKSDYPDPVNVGEDLTYSLLVANNGRTAATGVIVTDILPAGATFVSATPSQGTCSEAGGTVTCNLGNLASGWYAEVEVVVIYDTPAQVTNQAQVASNETDLYPQNNWV